MQLIADLHTHTLASTHAHSTLQEMVEGCRGAGMAAMAVTDHAPGMPDAPHIWHFHSLLRIPNWLPGGFLLLRGAEVDVLGDGTLGMEESLRDRLDWTVASMHAGYCGEFTFEQATQLWLRVAADPTVDMIGHPEQRQHPFDYDRVTKAFAAGNKVVELNASSATARPGNEENLRRLALACKDNGVKIAVNSDAHSVYNLHNQGPLLGMLEEIGFPQERIINTDMERLLDELELHGKDLRATRPQE